MLEDFSLPNANYWILLTEQRVFQGKETLISAVEHAKRKVS